MMKPVDHSDLVDAEADLTSCDREPIHLLGGVQSFGCLVSTSFDLLINHASLNCDAYLGVTATEIVGRRLNDIVPAGTIHELRTQVQRCEIGAAGARLFNYDVFDDGRLFDISTHVSDGNCIFEFEPKEAVSDRDETSLVQPLIGKIKSRKTVADAFDLATWAIQHLSGFDRVMAYRFAADGSGEVIAEQRQDDMEPYLGLCYPASDIPKQARKLYTRNALRIIADVDAEASPIIPKTSASGSPLDLSFSTIRSVSPVHLEYLRNMGVQASMSISILKDGKLWGLFACHHRSPRYVDFERRTAMELFAQFFSYELSRMIEAELNKEYRESRRLIERLMVRLSSGGDLMENFDVLAEDMAKIIASDGVAVFSEGRVAIRGKAPSREETSELVRFLNTVPAGKVFATSNLSALFPAARAFSDRAAGLLAIPISRTPRDFIVFFRREVTRLVTWAGNPEKPVEPSASGGRLRPRKSFEAWTETVRDSCAAWSEVDLRTADELRVALIEIVLKLTDQANVERRKASEKQELLIAELNHRVRNILSLIHSLVSQGKQGATDLSSYADTLENRVQALARAHDQLTKQQWEASSLRSLIEIEVAAYLIDGANRVSVRGVEVMLRPEAFSTMALVFHELITNSVKYGALSVPSGEVSVSLDVREDAALTIEWRETGGPAVVAPTKAGFGSTVIERTIPYELGGAVEARFAVTGFEADFILPRDRFTAEKRCADETDPASDEAEPLLVSRTVEKVLVVEDNIVIAMDLSLMLSNAGFESVELAGSVGDALKLLKAKSFGLGVLDVNLGRETSLPIADELKRLGVPVVLATGYADVESVLNRFPEVPVVQKPYNSRMLLSAIKQALRQQYRPITKMNR